MARTARVQIKAEVSQALKREALSVLALRGQPFAVWLRIQLVRLVQEASRETYPPQKQEHTP